MQFCTSLDFLYCTEKHKKDTRRNNLKISDFANTEIFKKYLKLDDSGYIVTKPGSTLTNIPGIFATGDAQDKIYRQAVTAAGSGCMGALDAERFISNN